MSKAEAQLKEDPAPPPRKQRQINFSKPHGTVHGEGAGDAVYEQWQDGGPRLFDHRGLEITIPGVKPPGEPPPRPPIDVKHELEPDLDLLIYAASAMPFLAWKAKVQSVLTEDIPRDATKEDIIELLQEIKAAPPPEKQPEAPPPPEAVQVDLIAWATGKENFPAHALYKALADEYGRTATDRAGVLHQLLEEGVVDMNNIRKDVKLTATG